MFALPYLLILPFYEDFMFYSYYFSYRRLNVNFELVLD